ncbi:translocation protein Sec63 isoform X2 [Arctopsyche grandis]|uniref:translocation protein Sec63 isoform X2 n=1 Tax=Arctopsyche grandis TaxID=121162 RepID=UPI00406D8E4E
MAGQKFEYDESGATFFYFLLSFLALVLVPATFYYWPRRKTIDPDKSFQDCSCPGCIKKKQILETSEPYRGVKNFLIKASIILGWLILILLAYKVSQFDYEMSNFDPYEILGVPPGASQAEIKKSYRKLSLILHPDKETGNEKAFMKLTKAYQALTDDEARKNWEKYGNPDGPGAMSFGIALPSWIVEKENSVWVLGLYGLVFMVALPTVVGTWWYRSIKFSGDQVLLDTSQLYMYFIHKTNLMALKRVIMILAASCEFDKRHNSEVVERMSDNEEVPQLVRDIPNLNEKNKQQPLCRPYSIKARALLHAHLSRMVLNPETLEKDRQFIVRRAPYLVLEMVNCVNNLTLLAYAGRIQKRPRIETIEVCMKLSPLIVQALWEYKSPLLQLPYITEENLKYFSGRKKHVQTLQQLAQMPEEDRRQLLRGLNDQQYEDLIQVLSNMPFIHFKVNTEVIDDENSTEVTAGAIVTVTVSLKRSYMKDVFGNTSVREQQQLKEPDEITEEGEATGEPKPAAEAQKKDVNKKPVWMKPPKKSSSSKKSKSKAHSKVQQAKEKAAAAAAAAAATATAAAAAKNQSAQTSPNGVAKKPSRVPQSDDSDASNLSDNDDATEGSHRNSEAEDNDKKVDDVDDDTEWNKFQNKIQKREKLEGRSKTSHPVHCPYYPEDKQEYWWTYICDRKSLSLLTAPSHVTNLVDTQDVQLRFTAPMWPGPYVLTVCLRSDSYIGMDQQQDIKLDVKEAPDVPTDHPQWDISDSESDHQAQDGNESEFTTDDDENGDDN